MAYPTKRDSEYSYTAFEQSQGDSSFPGTELDADVANLKATIDETVDFITNAFRSDGILKVNAAPSSTDGTDYQTAAAASAAAAAASAVTAASSAAVTPRWAFSTNVNMGDPGVGLFRLNNSTVGLASAMSVSAQSGDTGNPNLRLFVAAWDDSTNAVRGTLMLRKVDNPAVFAVFNVTGALTDNTSWLQLALTYVTGAGTFAANDTFMFGFSRSGDTFSDGDKGDVTVSASGATWTIDNGAVTTVKILDANVTTAKIADANVTTAKLADGAVTSAKVAAGAVVQVVNTLSSAVATGTTLIPYDDSVPQSTEGDQYMSLAITPKATTNLLKIDVVAFASHSAVGDFLSVALFQDSTAGALAAVGERSDTAGGKVITFTHYMTAGTVSATTFKVRAGGHSAGTTTWNGTGGARRFGGVAASSITITEIKG